MNKIGQIMKHLAVLVLMITVGIILLYPVLASAFPKGEIEGIWEGTLKFSGMELQVVFTISRISDETLAATYDVPEQNVVGAPVDKIAFDRGNVRLEIIPIEGVFEGKLSEEGDKIEGQWMQGGMTLPLVLERAQKKPRIKRPQEPKEPFPYKVEEIDFKNIDAGIRLAGTLTLPPTKGTSPAVLLLSGSGAQDRDEAVFGHRPFLVLADYLTQRGIAVLRVDDRGVGGSTGDFDQATAVDYTADAMAGITYLKSRKEINQEAIGLIGHSEGGIIASLAAARSPEIAFIVLIASPGMAIKEMEYSEQARSLRAKGANEDLIAKSRTMQDSLFAVIAQEADSNVVKEKFNSIISKFFIGLSEEEKRIFEISEESLEAYIHNKFKRLHSPWFRFYLPFDPGSILQKVSCPALAINGEKDIQVISRENLHAIKRALKAGGNKNYTVKELPNLNHLLQTAETGSISEYGKIEETMSPIALHLIGDWILKTIQ